LLPAKGGEPPPPADSPRYWGKNERRVATTKSNSRPKRRSLGGKGVGGPRLGATHKAGPVLRRPGSWRHRCALNSSLKQLRMSERKKKEPLPERGKKKDRGWKPLAGQLCFYKKPTRPFQFHTTPARNGKRKTRISKNYSKG